MRPVFLYSHSRRRHFDFTAQCSGVNHREEWVDGTSLVLIGAWSSNAPEIVELDCERIS